MKLPSQLTYEILKANNVKFTADAYDKQFNKAHFSIEMSAADYEYTNNVEVIRRVVENYISTAASKLINCLPLIELFDGWGAVLLYHLQPSDFKIRLYGEKHSDDSLYYTWVIDDYKTGIKKAWSRCTQAIRIVNNKVPDVMQNFYNGIRITDVKASMGSTAWSITGEPAILDAIKNASNRNVIGISVTGANSIIVYSGDYWTCNINGVLVTFILELVGTGVKGEKPDPTIGFFIGDTYYKMRCV